MPVLPPIGLSGILARWQAIVAVVATRFYSKESQLEQPRAAGNLPWFAYFMGHWAAATVLVIVSVGGS